MKMKRARFIPNTMICIKKTKSMIEKIIKINLMHNMKTEHLQKMHFLAR